MIANSKVRKGLTRLLFVGMLPTHAVHANRGSHLGDRASFSRTTPASYRTLGLSVKTRVSYFKNSIVYFILVYFSLVYVT